MQKLPSGAVSIGDIVCPSTSACEAQGSNSTGGSIALGTTDGGSKWRTQTLPSDTKGLTTCYARRPACVRHWERTLQVTQLFVSTTNGGSTWTAQTLPSGFLFHRQYRLSVHHRVRGTGIQQRSQLERVGHGRRRVDVDHANTAIGHG